MWCKSFGILRWLAPLLILRSVGFSVFFCRSVNVRRVSLGIGHNGLRLGEVARDVAKGNLGEGGTPPEPHSRCCVIVPRWTFFQKLFHLKNSPVFSLPKHTNVRRHFFIYIYLYCFNKSETVVIPISNTSFFNSL